MRRREFITFLGGAAAASPVMARAQQRRTAVLGVLHSSNPRTTGHLVRYFEEAVRASGYVAGRNLSIEYRWADSEIDRLPGLAAELVQRRVDAMVVFGGPTAVAAAKSATATIPIVFTTAVDPVAAGWVASLNRPGGNMTGVARLTTEIVPKQQAIVRELLPSATKVAWLKSLRSGSSDAEVPRAPSNVLQTSSTCSI